MNSRKIIEAGHGTCMGDLKNGNNIFVGYPGWKSHSKYQSVNGAVLQWILEK
jgi:hypothetical protein